MTSRRRGHPLAILSISLVIVAIAAPIAIAGPANGLDEDVVADASTPPPPPEQNNGPCASDNMIEITGSYCPDLDQKCIRMMPSEHNGVDRCAVFAPSPTACKHTLAKKHFCIDKFEYPNKAGDKPVVMKTWTEAQEVCKAAGKRLCGDSEWTLACEGAKRLPYPYGLKRDAKVCNIDKSLPKVDERALIDPSRSAAEVTRLWQGEPSGSRSQCVSPFGVHDMTGNVDEWVVNESSPQNRPPWRSASKGGYWGPVRARCRPMTTAHGESFPFYQTGFRCCSDPK